MLHYAVLYNLNDDDTIIYYLVKECGAYVDAESIYGTTPLHLTLGMTGGPGTFPRMKCMTALLGLGADINKINRDNDQTMVEYTLLKTNLQSIRLLWYFLERGATLGETRVVIPYWLEKMQKCRELARCAARLLVGIRRFRYSQVLGINGMDITRFIAQLIWESRSNEKWERYEMGNQ